MCGVAGIFDAKLPREDYPALLERMASAVRHRGPDHQGILALPEIRAGLASRRLSIIDLTGGDQPIANEDGSVHVVFNGEIYNHRELRAELERCGHTFRTKCDTEVIVHLYEEAGIDCLDRLRGMFALAVVDTRGPRLLLARDGSGMKPLYWTVTPSGLLFGSEIRALLASGLVQTAPDRLGIQCYRMASYVPAPRTGFAGIEKLPAGGWLVVEPHGIRRGRFWQLRFDTNGSHHSEREQVEELDTVLRKSVASHLAADVPVGAFVSGGWDSSIVADLAAQYAPNGLSTFSIVFPEDPVLNEAAYASRMATHLSSIHHEIEFRAAEIPELLPEVIRYLEEPNTRPPAVVMYQLFRLAAQEVKAVLSGEGADEVFAGYPWFQSRGFALGEVLRPFVPRPLARVLQASFGHQRLRWMCQVIAEPDARALDLEWRRQRSQHIDDEFLVPEFRLQSVEELFELLPTEETTASCRDLLQRLLALEFTGPLADGILHASDKLSMAHSLEVRMPFLDRSVIEFGQSLPSRLKVRGGQEKYVLKPMAERLPKEIAQRRKLGLGMPAGAGEHIAQFARDVLLDTTSPAPFLDRRRIESSLNTSDPRSMLPVPQAWGLVNVQLWWNEFFTA